MGPPKHEMEYKSLHHDFCIYIIMEWCLGTSKQLLLPSPKSTENLHFGICY